MANSVVVSVTLRYPEHSRGKRAVSKEASWVKEWSESWRPKVNRRRDTLEGKDVVQGTAWRMSSREETSVE